MLNRRDILAASAVLTAGPTFLPLDANALSPNTQAASNRITLGFIGVGKQSLGHLGKFLGNLNVELVAVCDVVQAPAAICHLGNIGYRLGRELAWDPILEQFKNDADANKLLSREPRDQWKI